jgi:drug/metabolite transporter (DMT)-like permease
MGRRGGPNDALSVSRAAWRTRRFTECVWGRRAGGHPWRLSDGVRMEPLSTRRQHAAGDSHTIRAPASDLRVFTGRDPSMPCVFRTFGQTGIGARPGELTITMSLATSLEARRSSQTWLVWLALWTVYIVWGSTYLAIRVTVETLPPLLTAGVRFLVAGGLMYAWLAIRRGRASMRITGREAASCALIGGGLLLGGNGLVVLAERDVSSSLAALVIASVPLWVVLLRAVTGDRASRGTLLGVALGFFGVALLVLPGGSGDGQLFGVFLLIAAAALWATSSFMSSRVSLPTDPFTSTAFQMLFGGLWCAAGGFAMGEAGNIDVEGFSGASLFALAYLIVAGSLLAFTAYVWLLQNAPISKVATYAYVNPVIALVLGWLILSETISATMLVGAAIIVASVAFIVTRESGSRRAARKPERAPERIAELAPESP